MSRTQARRTAQHWDSTRFFAYKKQFAKTELCRYYAAGTCTKGAECKFAHGMEELSPMPNLKKTALCENFKKGKCLLPSDECSYAHGEHELRKGEAFQSIRKNSEELSPRSDGSSGKPVQPTPQGGQLPEFPSADERDLKPSLQHPQRDKEKLGQGLCSSKPLQKQRRQPLQDAGALDDADWWVSGSQKFHSTQGSELQLQELLKSMRELMMANPDLASRLAPPGLPMPSTGIMMCEDVFEPKSELLGHPMCDDEPWRVPLPRCRRIPHLISDYQPVWQL